jgi:predicted double-glycine peptidase
MHPILLSVLQTVGIILLALAGAWVGRRMSRVAGWWHLGYAVPLLLIALISLPRWLPTTALLPAFRWLMADRLIFAVMAPVCAVLLFTLRARLTQAGQKRAVVAFTGMFVLYFSVLPFVMPAFAYATLANLKPPGDRRGVCMQQTDYSCGPAAAVTMLKAMGIEADEGRLGILAHTNAFIGTTNGSLCSAIREGYGVPCRAQAFDSVAHLRGHTPCIAVVKFNFMVDHFVAVLDVTDAGVVVGDPSSGLRTDSPEKFAQIWRHTAIVAEKKER